MAVPPLPSGFDVTRHVDAGRADTHPTVGFDREQVRIPRFLIQLHYQAETNPVRWVELARIDHNETATLGHDVYQEGLYVDAARRDAATVQLDVPHAPLPANRGMVVRGCVEYLREYTPYFIDVFNGDRSPGRPPTWPDGGDRPPAPPTLITQNVVECSMSQERTAAKEILSVEELTEELADATGTTPEGIERGAEGLEIAPPTEAAVVDD